VGRPKFSFHTGFCCCRDRDTDTCTFQNCLDQVDDATFVDDDDFMRYACGRVANNKRGSYLTMLSLDGLVSVWKSTSELGCIDGVRRPKFDFHTG
jgi:hypothetical protein